MTTPERKCSIVNAQAQRPRAWRGTAAALFGRLGFFGDVTLFSFAQGCAGVILAVYVFGSARLLGPVDFALFQSLVGVYGIFMILGSPLTVAAVHAVADAGAEEKSAVLGAFLRVAAVAGIAVVLIASVGVPFVTAAMRCRSFLSVAALLVLLFSETLLTTLYGGIQGRNRYGLFSAAKVAESFLTVGIGFGLIFAGWAAAGALAGYALAKAAVLVLLVRRRELCTWERRALAWSRREVLALLHPMAAFGVLIYVTNVPMIVARIRLPDAEAGLFGVLFALRNVVFPFALAVAMPLYSRTVSREAGAHILLKALIVVVGLGLGFMALALFCPLRAFTFLFGAAYADAYGYMGLYGVALVLTMLSLVMLFDWAADASFSFVPLVLPPLVVSAAIIWPDPTITRLILIQAAALACCVLTPVLFRKIRAGANVERPE